VYADLLTLSFFYFPTDKTTCETGGFFAPFGGSNAKQKQTGCGMKKLSQPNKKPD
jgi:hypothetical protein